MLGPRVASAAAQAALEALSKDDPTLSREAQNKLQELKSQTQSENQAKNTLDPQRVRRKVQNITSLKYI